MRIRTTLAFLLGVACMSMPGGAHAQLGSGWSPLVLTQDFIDYEVADKHMRHDPTTFAAGGMTYDHTGNVETFALVNPMSNRVEHDTNHHYQRGKLQFQGDVQIFPGLDHQFIVQIFNAPASGPILALNAYSKANGTIEKQGGSVVIFSNAFGKTARVNIIHDLEANKLTVYINGSQVFAGSGGLGGSFNLKYGSYGSLNGSTLAKVQWTNVQLWTDGATGSGDAGAPGEDAATSDGDAVLSSEDATAPSEDATGMTMPEDAAGGSGGSMNMGTGGSKGGTGGRSGAGGSSEGAGGAGGQGGDGGEGGASTPPPRSAAKSGCVMASAPVRAEALWPLVLFVGLGVRRLLKRRRAVAVP
jgi:hypothetical protein